MSKAILVMDMPENCKECDLTEDTEMSGTFCVPADGYLSDGWSVKDLMKKPKWCPLKELPERKWENAGDFSSQLEAGYIRGFNSCLDMILEGSD